jgi:hypothetical protein
MAVPFLNINKGNYNKSTVRMYISKEDGKATEVVITNKEDHPASKGYRIMHLFDTGITKLDISINKCEFSVQLPT